MAGVRRTGLLILGWALVASACASTGATPKPFPMPHAAPASSTERDTPQPPSATIVATSIVGSALDLRGSPYRNGGTDPAGFDCSGFTRYVFGRFGLELPREVEDQFRVGRRVARREIAPGDLVFFSTVARGASHVAIAIGGDQFIHAPSSRGVVRVEHLNSDYWRSRFVGIRRVLPE